MRDYILEQITRGVELKDIQTEVEKLYKQEQNKRKKDMELEIARERAADAVRKYLTLATGMSISEKDVSTAIKEFETDVLNMEKKPKVRVKINGAEDTDAVKELEDFLKNMGLI